MIGKEDIFRFLDKLDPLRRGNPQPGLKIPMDDGREFHLHADIDDPDETNDFVCEWWLEDPDDRFVDGGFEPANNEEEIARVADRVMECVDRLAGEKQ
jgi:hypothetical protein